MAFYIFHTQSLLSWWCGFNLNLAQLMGRFWVFFFSHTAPEFHLWFYFHLCTGVVHWGLLLRLPWRTWVCPCEGQVWRWCSCLGHRVPGRTRYSRGLEAKAAGSIVLQKGMVTNIGQYTPLFLPGEMLSQRSLAGHSLQGCKELDRTEVTHKQKTGFFVYLFFFLFFACGSSAPVRVECEGSAAAWLAGTLEVWNV